MKSNTKVIHKIGSILKFRNNLIVSLPKHAVKN